VTHTAAPVEESGEGEDSGGDIEIVMPGDEPDETVSPQESRAEALPPPPPPERQSARQVPAPPIKPGGKSRLGTCEVRGGVQAGARGFPPVGQPAAGAGGGGKDAGAVASAPRVAWSKDAAKGAMASQVEEAPVVKVRCPCFSAVLCAPDNLKL